MAEPTDDEVPTEWAHTAKLASGGDTAAARDILRETADAIELGAAIPEECAQYVANAFRKILDHAVDADKALGLKGATAGRPKGAKTFDDVKLGAAYWLTVRRGQKPEQANALIRTATGADRTTIQRAAQACSAFESLSLTYERLLIAIISEQPALAAIIPPIPTAD